METATDIQKKLLGLPVAERARLALAAWESLVEDPAAAADDQIDPDGITLALDRDEEIESGTSKPISESEFRRLTSGD